MTGECHGSTTDPKGKDTEELPLSEVGPEGYAFDPRSSGTPVASSEDSTERPSEGKRKRRNKRDAALRDQQSTGRKRAYRQYPLDRNADCEWAGSERAGGGQHPIPGCGIRGNTVVGKQQARHHGPDKNTLNNEEGNVHRICHSCHNAWHAVNDPDYVWGTKVKGD